MGLKEITDKLKQSGSGDSGKNKQMMIVMPVLIVVFVFVLSRAFKSPASSYSAPAVIKIQADTEIKWAKPDVYPSNLRDPMKGGSLSSATDEGGEIIIRGIIYSDKPAVIINNKVMHLGEKVAGATIVKINKTNVEFEKNGKSWSQEVQQ
jgi:type II secretory pathway component PulC